MFYRDRLLDNDPGNEHSGEDARLPAGETPTLLIG
jgi:hypothetical protein